MSLKQLPDIGRRNSLPVLYTRGTYYEVGYDVGRTFRGLIEDFVSSFEPLHKELIPAYQTAVGKEAYDKTLAILEENFPHYVREIRGTADGAKVSFLHLMILHMDLIITNAVGKQATPSYGCSSICCTNEEQVILGHTEDALKETLNHVYIVSAHITEVEPQGRWKTKEENFTALCYAGHLPGFCMGFNHHGLVYSINVVFPEKLVAGKTPRHFLTRALLSAETMEKAQHILRDKGVGSADGLSVNMTFSLQEGDYLFHNAEVGPALKSDESPMSVLTLSPGESFAHANTFLRLKIPEVYEMEGESSERRLARVANCLPIETKSSIKTLLSDTDDKEYPIYRDGEIITVTVGIFDLLEKTWTLWMNKPANSEPILTLPLLFKNKSE